MPAISRNSPKRLLGSPSYTIRSTGSVVAFWIAAAGLILTSAWTVVRGDWSLAVFALPLSALLIWSMWVLLHQPKIQYDDDRVIIVNFCRTHIIPWVSVRRVEPRFGLTFWLVDDRRIQAVGAPTPRRSNLMPTRSNGVSGRTYDGDVSVLNGFCDAAIDRGHVIEQRWERRQLWVGGTLAALVAVSSLVGTMLP
ncbi:MAG: hypothetical protein ACKOXM_02105 [Agromyces sp.]